MAFNFNGVKANLEGINKYLEANGITLSDQDKVNIGSIFEEVDKSVHKEGEKGFDDGELDLAEQISFMSKLSEQLSSIKNKISEFFSGIGKEKLDKISNKKSVEQSDAINDERPQYLPIQVQSTNHTITYTREDIYLIALDQCIKRTPELKNIRSASERIKIAKNKYPKFIEKYNAVASKVTDMVIRNCTEYDVPEIVPVITNMLGAETGGFNFSEKVLNKNGSAGCPKGSMQTDLKTIAALYNNDKSSDVQFIKELKKSYKTPDALYSAIKTDIELGLKVGILIFKQKLRANGGNVNLAIKAYCGGSYKYDYPTKVPYKIDV